MTGINQIQLPNLTCDTPFPSWQVSLPVSSQLCSLLLWSLWEPCLSNPSCFPESKRSNEFSKIGSWKSNATSGCHCSASHSGYCTDSFSSVSSVAFSASSWMTFQLRHKNRVIENIPNSFKKSFMQVCPSNISSKFASNSRRAKRCIGSVPLRSRLQSPWTPWHQKVQCRRSPGSPRAV